MYLRIYVNNQIQTMGWAFALLMVMIVLGVVMIAVSRNRSSGKTVALQTTEVAPDQIETPTPTAREASTRPAIDLHPMVAQLKADLAKTLTVEDLPVPKVEETPKQVERKAPSADTPTTPATPATVIVGIVPVQKKERRVEERPSTQESQRSIQ